VTLTWFAATNASKYTIARANVSPQGLSTTLNGTCASTVSALTCTDIGVVENGTSPTNWTYADTPGLSTNWVGATSSPSSTVTIPAPSLSLGTTAFTADGGSTSATVANFFDNEGITYCLDQSSSCTTGDKLGTDTVPATGGSKTTASITVPAGLSVGGHTVWAIGSSGSLPSVSITVTAGAPTKLGFSTQPGSGTGGTAWSQQPVVAIEDAHGNVVTSAPNTAITLAISNNAGPSGTLTCTSNPVTTSSGSATFAGCALDKAGTGYTLIATGTYASSTSSPFNITAGSLAKFSVIAPTSATAGSPFTVTSITAQDAGGNTVTSYTGTECVTFSGPSGSPSGATPTYPAKGTCSSGSSVAFVSGVSTGANSPSVTLVGAQSTNLTVTDNVSGKAGASGTITVSAGTAVRLAWTAITTSSPGTPTPNPCFFSCAYSSGFGNKIGWTAKVSITDSSGNTVSTVGSGQNVTVTLVGSDGSLSPASPATLTMPATGAAQSSNSITFTGGTGPSWTDTLSATSGTYTSASASFSK
jgi:hypothetical protein